jgi:uncharacterized protein YycO
LRQLHFTCSLPFDLSTQKKAASEFCQNEVGRQLQFNYRAARDAKRGKQLEAASKL